MEKNKKKIIKKGKQTKTVKQPNKTLIIYYIITLQ